MNFYEEEVKDVTAILENGGVILYPTDTIWGLGCDIFNEEAVRKIYTLKNRPFEKKMSLLVSDGDMLEEYVEKVHPRIHSLNDYHERPVTVIYSHAVNLPSYLLGANGSIAIRIVKDDFCQAFIRKLGKPIISTSANVGGEPFPANFSEVSDTIRNGVDYIVKHRQGDNSKSLESIIVKLTGKKEFEFLRK